jgi:RNA polymerase sigma-70 factor (ECF subfamily)
MHMKQRSGDAATDAAVGEAWREHRRHLLDIAYRMLGSVTDAEDIVQEAFTRMLKVDLEEIDDLRGWLVVVVSRLCLDQLRSARSRHEAYVGPWLPEPLVPSPLDLAPDERVTLDDTVRMALLVVLERLSPAERVAFILHDVFEYSFDDIAGIMHRSSVACRQLASRARRHVQKEGAAVRGIVDPVGARRVAEQFIAAAASGDLQALLEVLDPEAAGQTDTGGAVPAPRVRIVGREKVGRLLLAWLSAWEVTLVPMPVNAAPGAIAMMDGEIIGAITLDISDGVITEIRAVANPAKLSYVKAVLAGER